MHIISKAPFEESARKYPNDALALQALYRVIKETDFSTPEEMRTAFPNLDNFRYRNKWYVLDVGGNNLRVIAYINFDTLLQREQRMTANAARAVKATRELVNAVPFLGGSDSEDDYREALELVEYLIEEDDTNPLIDFLASRIAEYENNNEKFAEFDKAVAAMPVGVALLRTLIDQHNLTYADLKNEIGSKSLVSQILSGQRSLTISHIKALSARFGVKPEWFL